jgi:hypothetical protein
MVKVGRWTDGRSAFVVSDLTCREISSFNTASAALACLFRLMVDEDVVFAEF